MFASLREAKAFATLLPGVVAITKAAPGEYVARDGDREPRCPADQDGARVDDVGPERS